MENILANFDRETTTLEVKIENISDISPLAEFSELKTA